MLSTKSFMKSLVKTILFVYFLFIVWRQRELRGEGKIEREKDRKALAALLYHLWSFPSAGGDRGLKHPWSWHTAMCALDWMCHQLVPMRKLLITYSVSLDIIKSTYFFTSWMWERFVHEFINFVKLNFICIKLLIHVAILTCIESVVRSLFCCDINKFHFLFVLYSLIIRYLDKLSVFTEAIFLALFIFCRVSCIYISLVAWLSCAISFFLISSGLLCYHFSNR